MFRFLKPAIHRAAMRRPYYRRVLAMNRAALVVYFPLWEASGSTALNLEGSTARNATYANVTLGYPGIGDGRTSPCFQSSSVNILTASLQSAFNGSEGTLILWAKTLDASVWGDATNRSLVYLAVDSNNYLDIIKPTTENTLRFRYKSGGVLKSISHSLNTMAYFCVALIWSAANDRVSAFVNGAQVGSTLFSLGAWAGSLTYALLGASSTTPATPWRGHLAHFALWSWPLSSAQILWLSRPWMGG